MNSLLIVIFGLTMIYVSSTSRLEAYIRALAVQGLILAAMALIDVHIGMKSFIFLGVETLVIKVAVIPWILFYTIRKNGIQREDEPYITNFYSVVITSWIFVAGFAVAYWADKAGAGIISPLYFGVAMSTIVTGLFVIISRKKVITHVMGYVMIENGIFLLALSFAREMPMIVNLGVLLDLFAAIFLLGLFVTKINSTFEELQVENLMNLRD